MSPSLTTSLALLALAVLFDLLVGEYPPAIHPVVWIGRLVGWLLRVAPPAGWWRQFIFGAFVAVITVTISVAMACVALYLSDAWPWLQVIVGAFLLKSCFALRELGSAAARVVRRVEAGDLSTARGALRSLCSRDPSELGPEELLAGTVASMAENASDSVVAPLLYYVLLGVPGAVAYRAINTLDAMVGYRGKFEALGKFSARLDDVANWLPSRLTALLLLLAGILTAKPVANGWRIWRRDARKTPSPNGGRPMATVAGLLQTRLEKKGVYELGDADEPITPAKAREAWRLVTTAAWMMFGLSAGMIGLMATFAEDFLWPLPGRLLHLIQVSSGSG
jgi:adenosylcobinamide-phosphate synthase